MDCLSVESQLSFVLYCNLLKFEVNFNINMQLCMMIRLEINVLFLC